MGFTLPENDDFGIDWELKGSFLDVLESDLILLWLVEVIEFFLDFGVFTL